MTLIKRNLSDAATYRRLLFLLSALALGPIWFIALVTIWSLCVGLAVTPLVIPMLIVLAFVTRGFAAVEAELARSLLEVDASAPATWPARPGFWAWLRGQFGAGFWRAQAYLLIRWLAGFPVAVALVSVLGVALGMLFAPAWVPFVRGGARLGFWQPHTFAQSLAFVPAGLLLLPAGVLVARPLAVPFSAIAPRLLTPPAAPAVGADWRASSLSATRSRYALQTHAAVDAIVIFTLVMIWVVTSRGYFWPAWVALPLAAALGIHGWLVLLADEPSLVRHFRGNRTLAAGAGTGTVLAAYLIAIWAISGSTYFWPVWPILGIVIVLAIVLATSLLGSPRRAEMAERIENLETTRAGAVVAQETELRRIERDLHDGAQARLVALGMSLGMAEQKLADDPQRAGELLAEARFGAEHALRELRDSMFGSAVDITLDELMIEAFYPANATTATHLLEGIAGS